MLRRPRRLRTTPAMRNFVAETQLSASQLVLPVFIADGLTEPRPISSLPGVYQHSMDSLIRTVEDAIAVGVGGIDIFGVPRPEDKDPYGTPGWAEDGIVNKALTRLRAEFGDEIILMADTCLDEFTDHGHCGILVEDRWGTMQVDNDATLEYYAKMAVSQAQAGAHMVSPSGMMDGQIRHIRQGLDEAGYKDVSIMAYSAKYASSFYGPFREAVGSSLEGDRRTYQQDPRNRRESLLEVSLDIEEGADIVMVKPGMPYLDILSQVAEQSEVPVAVYQVSGEYAMIEAAASKGWLEREATIAESLLCFKRAGADIILSYWAVEAAQMFRGQ